MIKMKYEEVLWRLKDHFAHHKDNVPHPYLDIAERLTYKAIEKQIPKKITHEATLQICATCPTCKNVLDEFMEFVPGQPKIRVTSSYCHFCGQALDWSEYGK